MKEDLQREQQELLLLLSQIKPSHMLILSPEDEQYRMAFKETENKSEQRDSIRESMESYDLILLPPASIHLSKNKFLSGIERLLWWAEKGVICFLPEKKRSEERAGISDLWQYPIYYKRILNDERSCYLIWIRSRMVKSRYPFERITLSGPKIDTKLRIAYLFPHKGLTGGIKMMLEQIRYLKKRGHSICILTKCKEVNEKAVPEWYDLKVDEEITVPEDSDFLSYIHDADIIVAGWITQLIELESSPIPVLYWEQGYQYLFGDVEEFTDIRSFFKVFEACYHTRHAIASVSAFAADQILIRYGRKTPLLENGIDTKFYHPGKETKGNRILLVGNQAQAFKNFSLAFEVLSLVQKAGVPFEAEWITPYVPEIKSFSFPVTIKVQPDQKELVKSYQEADILLFTSLYEGFGMPPLEAMACGTAVVCTDSGGIRTYARHKYNAYIVKNEDPLRLAGYIIFLICNPEVLRNMKINGRNTALTMDYSNTICRLETYLHEIAKKRE
ncbi:MAG: glycosyltransferase family 4 protein [Lachnospiraceae bacterium]|nr:glycosyltransferase family 4 protein [Lachnospiraceae bacterium]